MRGATLLAAAFSLLLTGTSASTQSTPPDRYRRPGESIETAIVAQTDILEAALRFYTPRGKQSRWLDRQLLPESPTSAPASLASAVTDALIRRLGHGRFCTSDARSACTFEQGGRLRVSAPYMIDADLARVVVDFESIWPAGPTVVSSQVLRLQRHQSRWRIVDRSALPAPAAR